MESLGEQNTEAQELEETLLVNLSISSNLLKEYRKAHLYADRVLRRNSKKVKALYNRAIAGS